MEALFSVLAQKSALGQSKGEAVGLSLSGYYLLGIRFFSQGKVLMIIQRLPETLRVIYQTEVMRDIPDRVYTSDSDLQETLQTTTPQLLAFRVVEVSPDYF